MSQLGQSQTFGELAGCPSTPESGHRSRTPLCPLRASTGNHAASKGNKGSADDLRGTGTFPKERSLHSLRRRSGG